MKQQIIQANYDEETGITYLQSHNKYGTFAAQVQCREEDKDIQNRWDGFSFCEYKIRMQTLKKKYQTLQERLKGMRQMQWSATLSLKDNKDPECVENHYCKCSFNILKSIESSIYNTEKQMEEAKSQYLQMKNGYYDFVEKTLELRRYARNKIKNEEPTEE